MRIFECISTVQSSTPSLYYNSPISTIIPDLKYEFLKLEIKRLLVNKILVQLSNYRVLGRISFVGRIYLVGRISLIGRILMMRREMKAEHKLADDVRTSNMK